MAFKFAEETKTTLTTAQQNLNRIESRIRGVGVSLALDGTFFTQKQHDAEVKRLQAALEDVKSRMSKDELDAYERVAAGKSEDELKKERAAAEKAMDANRDKPSI